MKQPYIFVFSLGGHAHPRCLVYEPKTPFTVHKKSLENWRGWCGLFVQIQNPHDFKRGLSKHEFDGLRFNCGHVGRPCGKFVYIDFLFIFVYLFIFVCWLIHHTRCICMRCSSSHSFTKNEKPISKFSRIL